VFFIFFIFLIIEIFYNLLINIYHFIENFE